MNNPLRMSALSRCLPSHIALAAMLLAAAPAAMASHVGEELEADQQTVAATDVLLGALGQYERMPQAQRAAALQRLTQTGHAAARAHARPARAQSEAGRDARAAGRGAQPHAGAGAGPARTRDEPQRARSPRRSATTSRAAVHSKASSSPARRASVCSCASPTPASARCWRWSASAARSPACSSINNCSLLDKKAVLLAADGTTRRRPRRPARRPPCKAIRRTLVVMVNFNDKADHLHAPTICRPACSAAAARR